MSKIKRKAQLDIASFGTLLLTVILFVVALFEKGLTHELLLEAGVFLISVKLVLGAQKTHLETQEMKEKLDEILSRLEKSRNR